MSDTDKMTIEIIENNINIVRSLYDDLRVVDPLRKKVLFYNKGAFVEMEGFCFSKLNKHHVCENCISIRALSKKRTFMKLENLDKKVFMITAIPFDIDNKTFVAELFKDVTNSFFYGRSIDEHSSKVNNIINDMKKISSRDSLTGIYNRRFIDERLPADMNKCANNKEPISIIMIDLDYFKSINDKFGHIGGDFVLKKAAKCFKKSIRNQNDWIARYGGEEFLVCIPGADEKMALNVAERMHDHIISKKIHYENNEINITASFGVYTIYDENITKEEFINCADKKLYEAKSSGRNKIVV